MTNTHPDVLHAQVGRGPTVVSPRWGSSHRRRCCRRVVRSALTATATVETKAAMSLRLQQKVARRSEATRLARQLCTWPAARRLMLPRACDTNFGVSTHSARVLNARESVVRSADQIHQWSAAPLCTPWALACDRSGEHFLRFEQHFVHLSESLPCLPDSLCVYFEGVGVFFVADNARLSRRRARSVLRNERLERRSPGLCTRCAGAVLLRPADRVPVAVQGFVRGLPAS